MKTVRILAVLFLLFAFWQLNQEPVHASTPCQDDCAANYSSCTALANDNYEECLDNAEASYNWCVNQADWAYEECIWGTCGGYTWTGCVNMCEGRLLDAGTDCLYTLSGAEGNCSNAQYTADEYCSGAYDACYNNCPPE